MGCLRDRLQALPASSVGYAAERDRAEEALMSRMCTDPHRCATASEVPHAEAPVAFRGDIRRGLVWTLLVISVIGNCIASYGAVGIAPHLACGVVTAVCTVVLIVYRLRDGR